MTQADRLAASSAAIAAAFGRAQDFFARLAAPVSLRARYGLIAALSLLAIDALAQLSAAVSAKRLERLVAAQQVARLSENTELEEWLARAAAAEASAAQWAALDWRAETPGVAGAEVQRLIAALASAEQMEISRLQVDPDPVPIPPTGEGLAFSFTGSGEDGAAVAAFLSALASAKPALFTNELALRLSADGEVFFTIGGVAPFMRTGQKADAANASDPAAQP
ncbi:MAG: GspMb/PilO family protein [Parvularculaceae bacterium]|nr:GspMb/PilO family protein [Parvularculaceae bacterium]